MRQTTKSLFNSWLYFEPSKVWMFWAKKLHTLCDGLHHRVPWSSGSTYEDICNQCKNVVSPYGRSVIVFDGYCDGPSTKDGTHARRRQKHVATTVNFTSEMKMVMKNEDFLSNHINKQRFVVILTEYLYRYEHQTSQPSGDADMLPCGTLSTHFIYFYSYYYNLVVTLYYGICMYLGCYY